MSNLNGNPLVNWGWIGTLGLLCIPLWGTPSPAAERIVATYATLEVSIPVDDLELYAKQGHITPPLADYVQLLTPKRRQQLRGALLTQIELPPQTVSNFLYTPTGEALLQRASTVVQSKSQGSNPQMLRSALIFAAADPEGLTILSLLRHFPDGGIQVDVAQGVEVFQAINRLVRQTNAAIAAIQKQAATTRNISPIDYYHQPPSWQEPGTWRWEQVTLQLKDASPRRLQLTGQARSFPVDLYLPQLPSPHPRPLVVLSHGLGSDRTAYAYFAAHLASHGFGVAALEHPGSSAQQIQAFLQGKVNQVSPPTEFLHRPLDVQYLLDQLEHLALEDPQFHGRFNLKQVGVMGHSFGAYTAMVLGGATLNFAQLRQDCSQLQRSLNLSLLLQCQVLQLPRRPYELRDARVKAAIAVNAIDRSLFGPTGLSQIQVPVMMIAGGADTLAPPLLEQIEPFTWLPGTPKYLALMPAATHFSTTGEMDRSQEGWPTPAPWIGTHQEIARSYLNTLGLAFFQAHILNQEQGRLFLSTGTVHTLSQPQFPISLIQHLEETQLKATATIPQS